MPTEVQRRPSESISAGPLGHVGPIPTSSMDPIAATKAQQQQLMQHREALRLALGSILTPKRPQTVPMSRSSSGTATPVLPPFGYSPSGSHTPAGTPPLASPYFTGLGPISSEHLHPHHAYQHHPHAHSRLARSASNSNSPTESAQASTASSAHPSPMPNTGPAMDPTTGLPTLPDLEPLPPALTAQPQPSIPSTSQPNLAMGERHLPARPSIDPLHASGVQQSSGRSTPRAKFLETLEGKSAWDALIHGSFT
ncbi:hypothetical protein CPB84DRAFT_1964186 [Gymnopilus junonius]|uniref:Uncharacterized protein n=1 Tax=Gymnopilus junonius TaxID=109634 RepID=A0A9P5NFY5_GYMJU|nr:hypothetical protein CPB84DRAFT_1964186 [Gymnopilus junonius]